MVFITVEVVLRTLVGLGNPPLVVSHPQIEYLMRPDQNVRRFGNRVMINEFGMRSERFPREKHDDEFRVLVIGDSVINGGASTDQADLATEQYRRYLQRAHPGSVSVGNVSAGSWGPGNFLAYVQEFGLFDADVVYVVISSHDLLDAPRFGTLNPLTHPTERPLCATSELLTRYFGIGKFFVGGDRDSPICARPKLSRAERESQSLRDLRDLIDVVRKAGPRFVVFLHPERPEVEQGAYNSKGQTLLQFLKENDVETHPLMPWYQRRISAENELYRDYIHPNAGGQACIFNAFKHVEKNLATMPQSSEE